MGMTPEGFVKNDVKKILKKYEDYIWCDWPVPGGYGKSTVDCIGHCCGQAFIIETKADGKKPTVLQEKQLEENRLKGGASFTIIGRNSPILEVFEQWIRGTINVHGKRLSSKPANDPVTESSAKRAGSVEP